MDIENELMFARGVRGWGLGEKGAGIESRKLVVTEQSRGCEVRHRECSR